MSCWSAWSPGCSNGCAGRPSAGTAPRTRRPILAVCVVLAAGFGSGCGRTVLVPEASPFRIGPGTRGRIYAMTDGEWRLSDNRVCIPEGWYVVPPSFVEDE